MIVHSAESQNRYKRILDLISVNSSSIECTNKEAKKKKKCNQPTSYRFSVPQNSKMPKNCRVNFCQKSTSKTVAESRNPDSGAKDDIESRMMNDHWIRTRERRDNCDLMPIRTLTTKCRCGLLKQQNANDLFRMNRRQSKRAALTARSIGKNILALLAILLLLIVCQIKSITTTTITTSTSTSTINQNKQANQRHSLGDQQRTSNLCQPHTIGYQRPGTAASGQQPINSKKVFCFYDIQDDFRPQDLNPCLCTHVVYSYVAVRKNLSFIAGKKGDLRSLASLKRKNPNLKLLVSLRPDDYFSFDAPLLAGPSSDNQNGNETTNIKSSSSMNEMHQKFAKRIRDFIVRHSLDGINLDWPYFAQTISSIQSSREHLSLTLSAINENFLSSWAQSSPSSAYLRHLQSPLITLTVSKDFYSLVDGYDFHQLNKLLDYVHLPAFDFDLNVDQYSIGHPARLHGISDAENLDTLVDLILSSGLPSDQLIAGIPTHAVQITSRPPAAVGNGQESATNKKLASSMDEQLEAAANISIVAYSEVCRVRALAKQQQQRHDCAQSNNNSANSTGEQTSTSCWTVSRSRDLTAPFAYDSEHWLGFDDETSVKLKAKYVLLRHLAGVAVFTLNHDDPGDLCGLSPFPLTRVVNSVLSRAPIETLAHSQASTNTNANKATSLDQSASQSSRTYFTRAPNHFLTATSLVAQIFGNKKATTSSSSQNGATTQGGDLLTSASDNVPSNHRQSSGGVSPNSDSNADHQLTSFVDIIEKFGSVNRLDGPKHQSNNGEQSAEQMDSQLPCDKVGYQRYPRDCSRFYRCVQTPPTISTISSSLAANGTTSDDSAAKPSSTTRTTASSNSITRLQYECPSGLVFDEQYQICNWPSWSSQCTGSGEVNSITNSKFVCPNSYGYFQNQENCEYFYYCSDYTRSNQSQAYQFRCPFELGFDEEKLQCNWKWLVKGCNVTQRQTITTTTSLPTATELAAQKYLAALEQSKVTLNNGNENGTSASMSSTASTQPETTTTTVTAAMTTVAPTSSTSTASPSSTVAPSSSEQKSRARRSLPSNDEPAEGRGFVPAFGSHITSLLSSVAAIREHRMKKSNQQSQSTSPMRPLKYPTFVGMPAGSLASPSQDQPTTGFRVRRRQSSSSSASSTSSPSEQTAESSNNDQRAQQTASSDVSASNPYKRRPAPSSIFPFLPSSAVYMLADSLRSYGEAIQDELNRMIRLTGDRVRDVFGQKPKRSTSKQHNLSVASNRRSSSDIDSDKTKDNLSKLVARLGVTSNKNRRLVLRDLSTFNAHSSVRFNENTDSQDNKRIKRTRRESPMVTAPMEDDGDLQALETGSNGVWVAAPQAMQTAQAAQQRVYQQQPAANYRDPLGRPAGYPLNPLDATAKAAVLGPEPKNFHQPSALIIPKLSGITQQDYERLVLAKQYDQQASRWPQNQGHKMQAQLQQAHDPMLSSASERHILVEAPPPNMASSAAPTNQQQRMFDHQKVIEKIMEQAREAFTIGGQQQQPAQQVTAIVNNEPKQEIPFGMPTLTRPVNNQVLLAGNQQVAKADEQLLQQADSSQRKRRTSVAMKLATLAMPKLITPPSTTPASTTASYNEPVTTSPSQKVASTRGYMSSLLPTLSEVVAAPARSIMNKAMGFNRAVQDLISTLAPGSSSSSTNAASTKQSQFKGSSTSPMPSQGIPDLQQQQQQQQQQAAIQQHQHQLIMMQQQQQAMAEQQQHHIRASPVQANQQQGAFNNNPVELAARLLGNKSKNGLLMLTENEARELSSQLDQLSKEQLEMLSNELNKKDQNQNHDAGNEVQNQEQLHQQQQSSQMKPQMTMSQDMITTESPDYVVRLLKMLSKTSDNPEDVHLLDQLAGQLNQQSNTEQSKNRPNSMIEIGQPDDLALLEALGLIPPGVEQQLDGQQHQAKYSMIEPSSQQASGNSGQQQTENLNSNLPKSNEQQGQSYNSYSDNTRNVGDQMPAIDERPSHMRPGSMKKLIEPLLNEKQQIQQNPNPYQYDDRYNQHEPAEIPKVPFQAQQTQPMQAVEFNSNQDDPERTKFVPVSLEMHGSTTIYNKQERPYQAPTTTTTTTTTRRPTEVVTQVFQEQFVEKVAPPVKQTFIEMIENNVTTPEGIETTIESRTKSAISSGANYNIGHQLGLGMIPRPFQGSVPVDSPLGQQQLHQQASELVTSPGILNASDVPTQTNEKSPLVIMQPPTSTEAPRIDTKGGDSTGGLNQLSPAEVVQLLKLQEQQQQQQQILANQQEASVEQQRSQFGQFSNQQQPISNGFASTASTLTSSNLVTGNGLQNLEQQRTNNAFAAPRSNLATQATLGGYNFATQPVNQFEELVIKKKFKPFPKTTIMPQTSSFTIEEVTKANTPAPTTGSFIIDGQQVQLTSQQLQQLQQVANPAFRSTSDQSISSNTQQFPVNADDLSQQVIPVDSTSIGNDQQLIVNSSFSTANDPIVFGSSIGQSTQQMSTIDSGETIVDINNNGGRATSEAELDRSVTSTSSTMRLQPTSLTKQELQKQLSHLQSGQDLQRIQLLPSSQQQQQISINQLGNLANFREFNQQGSLEQAQPLTSGQGIMGQVMSVGLAEALGASRLGGAARSSSEDKLAKNQDQLFLVSGSGLTGEKLSTEQPVASKNSSSSSKTSKSGKNRKGQRKMANTTSSPLSVKTRATSTSAPSSSTKSKQDDEDFKNLNSKQSTDIGQLSGSRVEEAFSNLMVELKRSRKQSEPNSATLSSTSTTTTSTMTSTTAKPKRKTRNKKQRSGASSSDTAEGASSSSSQRKAQQTSASSSRRTKRPSGNEPSREEKRAKEKSSISNKKNTKQLRRQKQQQVRDNLLDSADTIRFDYSVDGGQSRRPRPTAGVSPGDRLVSGRPMVQLQGSSIGGDSSNKPNEEVVAIYGTKSGFMPMLNTADGAAYASAKSLGNSNDQAASDRLSFGVSSQSSSINHLWNTNLNSELSKDESDLDTDAQSISSDTLMMENNDDGWRSFVRKSNDQISVVHLGNYSERTSNHSSKLIQVKLIILPASPDNQLLSEHNWQHLAFMYPQLFPTDLNELQTAKAISLGGSSINMRNGGLIDQSSEERRLQEFKRQFEQISALIEDKTFKALDEIIQRSSGQLFMLQRRDTLDRTLVAVIPERPFVRSTMAANGAHYERVVAIPAPNSSATDQLLARQISRAALRASKRQQPDLSAADKQLNAAASQMVPSVVANDSNREEPTTTPEKAATFSRAIKESIQEAIRQHYDSMKTQLRQSLQSDQQSWSTPPAESLARFSEQQTTAQSDPLEASSSSTEYSTVPFLMDGLSRQQQNRLATSQQHHQHSLVEVEGAEPKTLYGLDMPLMTTQNEQQQQLTTKAPSSNRFISIGSHLIASPMKKIVDQAYVNHFYDHISDHQLAKSIGFPDSSSASLEDDNDQTLDISRSNVTKTISTTKDSATQKEKTTTITMDSQQQQDSPVPESACTRPGLFQHPFACNKFYECFWDQQMNKYTFHMFECPIKLAFDDRIVGCAMPIESSLCVNY